MGEIKTMVQLTNYSDKLLSNNLDKKNNDIRTYSMDALIDTGSVMFLLPQDICEKLGLNIMNKFVVTYADERKEERNVAGMVEITLCERTMVTDCIVGPPNCEPLIGQLILERLDLIVDPNRQTIHPRPESPIYPSLKLK
jgi:clan AA aspartic protease